MADPTEADGGLPPLPESDDPWIVLDVEPGADERAVKRAYARRIKVYRPDRAPDAFARIQAAFEHVQLLGSLPRAADPDAGDGGDARIEPPAAEGQAEVIAAARRAAMSRLSDAVARDDDQAAQAAWQELLAVGGTAEGLIPGAPEAEQRWILLRTPITWRELSMWRHPGEAFGVWASAFSARLEEPEGLASAIEMADEPALIEDAAQDPTAAILFLKAVSSLAWRDSEQARRIFRRLRSSVDHPVVSRLVDRATLDVVVAGAEYHDSGRPPLPPDLMELLAATPFATHDVYQALEARIRSSLQARPHEYLAQLSAALVKRAQLGEALAHRLLDGVPEHRRELSSLTAPLSEQLHRELRVASRWTWWMVPMVAAVVVGVGAYLLLRWLTPALELNSEDADAVTYCTSASLLVFTWWCGEGAIYRWLVRRRLAGVLARVGVTRAAAREWTKRSWWRIRLARFGPWMERDHALRLVGMMAATVADDRDAVEEA